jgi:NodT family efflux transporter outer membrane factor (OMF) lipoprotein
MIRLGLVAFLMLPLTGCLSLKEPAKPALGSGVAPESWRTPTPSEAVLDNWLATFGDAELTALAAEALTNNPDLAAAAARLDQALASAKSVSSALLPALNLNGNAQNSSRLERTSAQKAAGVKANSPAYGASLDLSWELDVWGRLRYANRSATATTAASAEDYQAARRSLVAQVAKAWFAAAESQLQLQLSQQFVSTYEQTLSLVEIRFGAGAIAEQDFATAKADVAGARQRAEAAATTFKEAVRGLELLLGRYPAAELQVADDLHAVPPPVPAGVPAQVLERRPDIMAAERRVDAAFASTEEAKAARLPRLSLTSSLGSSSPELKDLLDPKNAALNFAGNLFAPLFDGGQRRAQVDLAQARQREAAANYRSTALAAFQEVENYLLAGESLARQETQSREAAEQYEKARRMGTARYEAGDIDLIELLILQRQELQAKSSLLSLKAQRLSERVNLHLALGGDFASADNLIAQ